MKQTIIAVSLLLATGLLIGCNGCNKGKDELLPDGSKLFGERTLLWGGTKKAERREWPNGEKDFDLTWLKDGSIKIGRVEAPDGEEGLWRDWAKGRHLKGRTC